MDKELNDLIKRALTMLNGLLAFVYVAGFTWLGYQAFNLLFQETNMSAKYDLTLYQGATFDRTLEIKDSNSAAVDITGYTFAAQIRTSALSGTVAGTFDVAIANASAGRVTMEMSSANTTLVPAQQCVYDLEMTKANGDVVRLLEGFVDVKANVTR